MSEFNQFKKDFMLKMCKQLKGIQKRSPIFFKWKMLRETDEVKVTYRQYDKAFKIDFNNTEKENTRIIYKYLFNNFYPKMENSKSEIYAIDKINVMTNEILVKKIEDIDSSSVHACKMKIPCFIFLKQIINNKYSESELWAEYVKNIDKVTIGEDIYHEV